jgi:anaerobic selenocysteine-containing dehydrogenase
MEQKVKSQGAQSVLINEADAAVRKINEGDKVRVFNKRGSYLALATLTEDVPAGVVLTTLGYWDQFNEGVANYTSSQEFSDIGHAPSYSDNLVEVKRL